MVEQFRQEPKGKKIMMTTLGSTRYDFCVKKSDSNAEKPSCAMLELRVEIESNQYLCHNSSQSNLRYIYMFHWYISPYLSIGQDNLEQRNRIFRIDYYR